jgi:hypothetical protein
MTGKGRWATVAAIVLLIAGTVVVVRTRFVDPGRGVGSGGNLVATSLATVTRGSLSQQLQVAGALGYPDAATVAAQAPGTVTWLPAMGQVVEQGQALYQLDGAPVLLLYGAIPAWHTLTAGMRAADVAQLNHNLVALGYLHPQDVEAAWDRFTAATTAGVRKLQHHLGADQTGTLELGAVVFLPGAARVTALQSSLGAAASGPILQASSTTPGVSVALAADRQAEVKAGDQVGITLPDGSTTAGTVTRVGTVATAPSGDGAAVNPTVQVTIALTDPAAAGRWDHAPVLVSITTTTVADVLTVPVNALLALASGGYAVEVADPGESRHLVPVTPGLFDDASGQVQVTGSGLSAGQHVVVPAS